MSLQHYAPLRVHTHKPSQTLITAVVSWGCGSQWGHWTVPAWGQTSVPSAERRQPHSLSALTEQVVCAILISQHVRHTPGCWAAAAAKEARRRRRRWSGSVVSTLTFPARKVFIYNREWTVTAGQARLASSALLPAGHRKFSEWISEPPEKHFLFVSI